MWYRIAIPILAIATACFGGMTIPTDNDQDVLTDTVVEEFKSKIYPLLTGDDRGCLDCHSDDSGSDLVFSGNAKEDLLMLLDGQYLGQAGPDSLLSRLTSHNEQLRMPKDDLAWDQSKIDRLAAFQQMLEKHLAKARPVDEQFPRALLEPYQGGQSDALPNQLISYQQLKGKIALIFSDDGTRGRKNLFTENVALLGGADFKTRYNESREPTAAFFTGLEILASDVSNRSYGLKTGPFAQFPELLTSPLESDQPTTDYQEAINHLYEQVLFRQPTQGEVQESYKLLRQIHQASEIIRDRSQVLSFEVSVTDPLTGLYQSRVVEIPVDGDRLEVYQQIVDQSKIAPADDQKVSACQIGPAIHLKPGQPGQRLVIHNLGTQRNVSFAGVRISSIDSGDENVQTIAISSPVVEIDGAWEIDGRRGVQSLEDRNNHKGQSSINIPLTVEEAGQYQVELLWRPDSGNATNVIVELFAGGAGNQLASSIKTSRPQLGEAHFFYDCGNDTIAFFKPETTFQFGEQGYVEVSNRETLRRVTAAAVEFRKQADSDASFLIDSRQAEGNQAWDDYNEGQFKAYNVKGKKLHDNNKKKGELSLRYIPATHANGPDSNDKAKSNWDPAHFYDVRIYYPGKVNHEPQVPVVIKAAASAPIIQINYPMIAKSDARLKLDASDSYTVQHSSLQFSWRQISGTPVDLGDSKKAVVEFSVPRPDVKQYAWSSLCAALLRHPDFLFTRPPSFFSVESDREKQKLQLVKIALDLVGRPPAPQEFKRLDEGEPLADLVDDYLDSKEFRAYYFHLVRLMLESHGTELDDEPARLWCYMAFNDRPFQEILTAEYTVDVNFEKKARSENHGKTGLLTTTGFIKGKPGLPHYNYAAQVSMLFLGYVYDVSDEIVEQREGATALGTTDPNSTCYSCHKILTPLAFQRTNWTDDGLFRDRDENGNLIDASDRNSVAEYPFAGHGMEAFATQAVRKERFIRTMINTHVNFYFGRPMRHRYDERRLYKGLWDTVHAEDFKIRELIRAIIMSPEYLGVAEQYTRK